MQLRFVVILWALLGCLAEPGAASYGSELAALRANDQCATDGPQCALSALQLESRSIVGRSAAAGGAAARQERITHHPGVSLQSRFFVGSGVSPSVTCNAEALDTLTWTSALSSAFGAGGGGAVWESKSLVIADGPERSKVDLQQPVRMKLTMTASVASWDMPGKVTVGGLKAKVPSTLQWEARGTRECPPSYCLMHEPTGAGLTGQTSRPPCNWGPALATASVTAPAAGGPATVLVDVSELVAAGYTVFKVWLAPSALKRNGMWQTSRYRVTSWGFSWVPLRQKKEA